MNVQIDLDLLKWLARLMFEPWNLLNALAMYGQ
jgi:hypothetical protein